MYMGNPRKLRAPDDAIYYNDNGCCAGNGRHYAAMSKSNHRHKLDKMPKRPRKPPINPYCGHLLSDVIMADEGTSYCRECEREARFEAIEEYNWDDE